MSNVLKNTMISVFLFSILHTCLVSATVPSEIEWLDTIGHDKTNPDLYYSILFLGFLRQELSPDCKIHMADWLAKHPKAVLVPVAIDEPFNNREPKSKLTFVWIIDGHDNLGVDLVRHGCAPATFLFTLMRGAHLEISVKKFDQVKEKLKAAEKLAKAERLGIWSDDKTAGPEE